VEESGIRRGGGNCGLSLSALHQAARAFLIKEAFPFTANEPANKAVKERERFLCEWGLRSRLFFPF